MKHKHVIALWEWEKRSRSNDDSFSYFPRDFHDGCCCVTTNFDCKTEFVTVFLWSNLRDKQMQLIGNSSWRAKRSWKLSILSEIFYSCLFRLKMIFDIFFMCHENVTSASREKKNQLKKSRENEKQINKVSMVRCTMRWFCLCDFICSDDIEWLLHWCVKHIKDVRHISIDQREKGKSKIWF